MLQRGDVDSAKKLKKEVLQVQADVFPLQGAYVTDLYNGCRGPIFSYARMIWIGESFIRAGSRREILWLLSPKKL